MKTLVIDAIIGAGFPTLTLALTAEQAGLATFVGAYLSPSAPTHQWCRDKLEGETLQALQTIYEGLRSERDLQAQNDAAAVEARPSIVVPFQVVVH